MALFDISKKVEGKLSDVVGKEAAAKVMDKVEQTCGEALSGLCNIKVLGSGCKNCHNLLEAASHAVDKLGLPVYHCTDGALRAVNQRLVRKIR